jgi:multiple sugar transport system substrate-binding protein
MTLYKTMAGAMLASTLFAGAALAQTELTMWYHGAGNETEMVLVNEMLAEFNASQSDWKVVITTFPQGAYNDAVVAGALA